MRRFAVIVTLAAFAAHALLGCCWHHGHAESTGAMTASATIKPIVHGDHVHFHGSSHADCESTPANHQHDEESCDDGACIFVAANRASDVSSCGGATCQWAPACLAFFTPIGASQLRDSFAVHRCPPDFSAGHCALYLSLRTLRI